MGTSWDPPKWRQEGRTGPNGPKYAKAKDRATVRRGGTVGQWKGDSNPGGPGGRTTRIRRNGGGSGGGSKNDKSCCFWVEAGKAVWAGKFKLARAYARRGIKHNLGVA